MALSKQQKNFGWRASNYFNLINYPIFTEKSDNLRSQNQYTFTVNPSLTKIEIKLAIQKLFKVKVKSVNTSMQIWKKHRLNIRFSSRILYSKTKLKVAIVTLAPKNSIELLQIRKLTF